MWTSSARTDPQCGHCAVRGRQCGGRRPRPGRVRGHLATERRASPSRDGDRRANGTVAGRRAFMRAAILPALQSDTVSQCRSADFARCIMQAGRSSTVMTHIAVPLQCSSVAVSQCRSGALAWIYHVTDAPSCKCSSVAVFTQIAVPLQCRSVAMSQWRSGAFACI